MTNYVRLTNGSTTRLINVNNAVGIQEALDDGFVIQLDEDDMPSIMTSEELMAKTHTEQIPAMELIRMKAAEKNAQAMRKQESLAAYTSR